jgi:hypothetical protein
LPAACGVASGVGGVGLCALTQTIALRIQKKIAVKRQRLFAGDIDLETFQQGTFGPDEMVNTRVAEDAPVAKNCGVSVKIASITYPSLCCRIALLFFDSCGPLMMTVEPDKLPSDD